MSKIENYGISNFMSKMRGGARPNQFRVLLSLPEELLGKIPNSNAAEGKFQFFCNTSAQPKSTIGKIDLDFRGHQIKVAGDRVVDDWNVSILNDPDHMIRNVLESWSDSIVGMIDGDENSSLDDLSSYMGSGQIDQLDRNGNILKSYNMIGVWPQDVGEITLDMSSRDSVEEFTTMFAVQWWESNTTRNNTVSIEGENGGLPVIS